MISHELSSIFLIKKYKNLEIILDESDHISTDFKTLKETRILENKERWASVFQIVNAALVLCLENHC